MSLLLNWKAWAAIVLSVALAGSHWKAYTSGKKAVLAEWNAEKLEQAAQSFRLSERTAQTTATLQAKADTQRRAKNAEIEKLDADLAAALARLSDRPSRAGAGSVSQDAGTGASCTGASLWREDGEFLSRESARADTIRLQLIECQAAYSNAREALK